MFGMGLLYLTEQLDAKLSPLDNPSRLGQARSARAAVLQRNVPLARPFGRG